MYDENFTLQITTPIVRLWFRIFYNFTPLFSGIQIFRISLNPGLFLWKIAMRKRSGLLLLLVFCFGFGLFAQNDSTLAPGFRRNSIKWNMTPFLLWSRKDINISYERVLKPYRSFSVNVGYFELPVSGLFDNLYISKTGHKSGLTVSGDYRYYFKKRNRRSAPDGLYWGPYGSFHYTKFGSDVDVINNDLVEGSFHTNVNLSIMSTGVEMGYQFVIKERLTIDLLFIGPFQSLFIVVIFA